MSDRGNGAARPGCHRQAGQEGTNACASFGFKIAACEPPWITSLSRVARPSVDGLGARYRMDGVLVQIRS
jgi:hypothetical protein